MNLSYETERLILKPAEEKDIPVLMDYLLRNRDFLKEWEPLRDENYYQEEGIKIRLKKEQEEASKRKGIYLYIFLKGRTKLIGTVSISSIVYGPFQSCFLGYKLDKDELNNGYMTEALKEVITICFDEYKLHRIEANVMPRNNSSIRVLEKLGFEAEGISKKYLMINGKWEDHVHYVLLNKAVE